MRNNSRNPQPRPPPNPEKKYIIHEELEAAAARVTCTPTETKQLLDIIGAIIVEGYATEAQLQLLHSKLPANLFLLAKENGALLEALLQQTQQNKK